MPPGHLSAAAGVVTSHGGELLATLTGEEPQFLHDQTNEFGSGGSCWFRLHLSASFLAASATSLLLWTRGPSLLSSVLPV